MTEEERARQVGMNEALFRQVNERIEELTQGFRLDEPTMHIVCECGDASCAEQLEVELALYERVREDPHLFLIARGHDVPGVESVVESRDGIALVRKDAGLPQQIAERTDPRG